MSGGKKRVPVSVEDVAMSNSFMLAALLELLEERSFVKQSEVLERVRLIKARGKPN